MDTSLICGGYIPLSLTPVKPQFLTVGPVTINLESGAVKIAEGVTVDEAAQHFWDAVSRLAERTD